MRASAAVERSHMMAITSTVASGGTAATKGNVHVTGRRIVATIIDGFVIGGIYAAMAAMFGSIATDGGAGHLVATMPAAGTVAYAVVVALYFVLLESYRGQTLGKMAVGIKVVGETTGTPPGLAAATVRTALRLVDGLASYFVAFIAVLATAKRQRLGDMAAHTVVVRA
jgi:uncharacterized RDD family membrane protein YckC